MKLFKRLKSLLGFYDEEPPEEMTTIITKSDKSIEERAQEIRDSIKAINNERYSN